MTADPGHALSVRAARDAYFAENGLPADGGYHDKWVKLRVLGIPFAFPNTEARKRQVPAHDVHHILTGYRTDVTGEAEIGGWEIGSGCDGPARHLGLRVMSIAVFWAFGRIRTAFVRGRHTRNFYGERIDDALLHRPVAELRDELGLDAPVPEPTREERVAFLGWCAAALAIGFWPIPVGIGLWWWLA